MYTPWYAIFEAGGVSWMEGSMHVEWKVRRAELADVPAIVALSDALFREDSGQRDPLMNHDWAQQHGQQYFRGLLDNRAYLILIAEEHGEVVGYLAGSTSEAGELRTVRSAELESMCVAPASRGRRAGEALAQAFLQWAQEQGAAWITVTAYAANRGALSFYERLGFLPHAVTLGQRLG
jgi:ribosomal protein S18 acetylase RimI-like enzyme